MKKRVERLEELYQATKRELEDCTVYNLIISEEKNNINYKPSYQRKFIWDTKKSVNLIETIFLRGIIPPLTVIKVNGKMEIIDGRQRYETLLKFYNNEFKLRTFGLEKLKDLDGKDYAHLPQNLKTLFEEYRMKMIIYTVEDTFDATEEDIELLKRDLFKRYNFGMTALKKSEIARAKYLYDDLTNDFINLFDEDTKFYNECAEILLAKSKRKEKNDREKKNLLLVNIREVLVIPYIPIIGEKTIKIGAAIIDRYYDIFIRSLDKAKKEEKKQEFIKIIKKLSLIKLKLKNANNELQDNVLFFKSAYWMLAILYNNTANEFYDFNVDKFYHYIINGAKDYFDNFKNITSEHIENRHLYMKKYIEKELELNIDSYIESTKSNKNAVKYKKVKINKNADYEIGEKTQLITVEEKLELREVIKHIKEGRFVVQPKYQRAEVKSKTKASRIIESIILGVKLPPIYLYTKTGKNGLYNDIVLDGQQRLISILAYMGESITDEDHNYLKPYKAKYSLTGLKDLDLNGKFYEHETEELNPFKKDKIKKYIFDVIRINEQGNENFDFVDLFLRLNQNPCPISINTFEMWNSFSIIDSISQIKEIAKYKLFRQSGNRMKEEELVTTLAYMDYKDIDIDNMEDFFTMYTYVENKDKQNEHIEVKISVKDKKGITDYLEEMEPKSKEEKQFLEHINCVNDFVSKLKILSEKNEDILIKIFNPNLKVARNGNKKDFYVTWLILKELDTHMISTYKEEILKDLEKVFKYMKNMPEDKNVKDFIDYMQSIANHYASKS